MPSWFSSWLHHTPTFKSKSQSKPKSKSKSKSKEVITVVTLQVQPPRPSAPVSYPQSRPMSRPAAPKRLSPISSGTGMRPGRTSRAVAAESREHPPLPKSPIHRLEIGADATRTTRFALPSTRPEPLPSASAPISKSKARGPEYVTITTSIAAIPDPRSHRALPTSPPAAARTATAARQEPAPRIFNGNTSPHRVHPAEKSKGGANASLSGPAPFTVQSPRKHAPRIGPFKLLRELGNGVFAKTYAAQDVGTGRVVCARVSAKRNLSENAVRRQGLFVEAQIYLLIATAPPGDRARFMELYGVLQDEERVVFAMPLMDIDLFDVLHAPGSRGPGRALARRWAAQLALGIDALHKMGVIHRDLKPENILVDAPGPYGNVRIADFNAALLVRPYAKDGEVYSRERIGSAPYLALEVDERRWYGKMVDWWALGCITFDLITQEFLFQDSVCRGAHVQWSQNRDMGKVSWPAFAGSGMLTDGEESLVLGLIDVNPRSRFQLRHLRHHSFFVDENHGNVFDVLLREPPSDLLTDAVQGQGAHASSAVVVDEELKEAPLIYAVPQLRTNMTRRTGDLDKQEGGDDDNDDDDGGFGAFGWVNGRGIWGASSS